MCHISCRVPSGDYSCKMRTAGARESENDAKIMGAEKLNPNRRASIEGGMGFERRVDLLRAE